VRGAEAVVRFAGEWLDDGANMQVCSAGVCRCVQVCAGVRVRGRAGYAGRWGAAYVLAVTEEREPPSRLVHLIQPP
jgi:hypothetical protein